MSDEFDANAEGVDFALVAYREEGVWQLEELAPDAVGDLDGFAQELRRYPGDGGSLDQWRNHCLIWSSSPLIRSYCSW